jgi:hypothetical protein
MGCRSRHGSNPAQRPACLHHRAPTRKRIRGSNQTLSGRQAATAIWENFSGDLIHSTRLSNALGWTSSWVYACRAFFEKGASFPRSCLPSCRPTSPGKENPGLVPLLHIGKNFSPGLTGCTTVNRIAVPVALKRARATFSAGNGVVPGVSAVGDQIAVSTIGPAAAWSPATERPPRNAKSSVPKLVAANNPTHAGQPPSTQNHAAAIVPTLPPA